MTTVSTRALRGSVWWQHMLCSSASACWEWTAPARRPRSRCWPGTLTWARGTPRWRATGAYLPLLRVCFKAAGGNICEFHLCSRPPCVSLPLRSVAFHTLVIVIDKQGGFPWSNQRRDALIGRKLGRNSLKSTLSHTETGVVNSKQAIADGWPFLTNCSQIMAIKSCLQHL